MTVLKIKSIIPGSKLFSDFFNSEKAGGIILIGCTILSIFLSNSGLKDSWLRVWETPFAGHSVTHWINDGLMAIFFLLIGLELEREIYTGELSSLKRASLPIFAAAGGMVVPALIFAAINAGKETIAGTGIPMATDIAFAIGILSLLGKRIPDSLKIFLVALAVMDDLGAIIIIALFYTSTLSLANLLFALLILLVMIVLNRLKVMSLAPYLAGGCAMWYFMLHSGIHATITGVLLAFAIPFRDGGENSPSFRLQHFLHKPVAYIILPLFALANTSLAFGSGWFYSLTQPLATGIIFGLVAGKPLGILVSSMVGILTGLCVYPTGTNWKQILGVGFLGGIGFTMSIFITLLAFSDIASIDTAKIAILSASLISGLVGFAWLWFFSPKVSE